ncbi:MAG: trypsin-like peptidase domain-containing protein [Actinomycetota bacterium]
MATTTNHPRTHHRPTLLALLVAMALFAVACGSGSSAETAVAGAGDDSTAESTPDGGDTTDTTGGDPGVDGTEASTSTTITTVSDLDQAVVQIVAQGSFIDPEEGLVLNSAGAGSGFFIDQSGLVVTNNHVVTGAATLEVFVNGESRNARLVASSECSDLAVIDVDGEGYPALDWYTGTPDVGLGVYAAGFPLGDPEFTLTRGIVSRAQSDGDTIWASVDAVLEHDANINPGNSGGPLVTEDGQVVGVNYAGRRDTAQFFAISGQGARPIIDRLVAGEPVDWIGINGQAIVGDDFSGVWVSAVESGSPAARAGLRSGDIITRMEGLVLATDGTMADYCDVLRTRGDSAIAIEVLRLETSEVLEGEINGSELRPAFSFAAELEGTEMAASTPSATAYEYTFVTDDTGLLSMEIPTAWSDVSGVPVDDIAVDLRAAPDLAAYEANYDVPGVQFTVDAAPELLSATPEQLVGGIDVWRGGCTVQSSEPYTDGLYSGYWEAYSGCGGSSAGAILVVARPADATYTIILAVQVVTDADLEAADRILDTFFVNL